MKDTANRGFWNRWAGIYDRFMRSDEALYNQIASEMKQSLSRDMQVLELACGTGLLSVRIAGSVKSLEATDFSPEMIAEAKKKAHSARLHFSVQDATSLPYANDTFDAVLIANALHIMPEPERALSEIRRVLKPGGRLYAPTFVHGQGVGYRLRVKLMEAVGFKVYSKWSAEELARFIEENGFSTIQMKVMGSKLTPLCYLEARKA